MAKEETQQKKLQWHPAFYAGLQIELEEERDKLIFENEHQLSTKPLEIDVVIIKKQPGVKIQKNIGQIFRTHNMLNTKDREIAFQLMIFTRFMDMRVFISQLQKK